MFRPRAYRQEIRVYYMVFNGPMRRIATAVLIFSVLPFVYAQEAGYVYDTSGGQPRFFQRLSWTGDDYALSYEVIIEKKDNSGDYAEVLREKTSDLSINVSLASGFYRYSIIPLNLLGRSDEGSEWRMFEVLPAYIPSIEKFYPAVFYMDRYMKRELDIAGDNLLEESEISLRKGTYKTFPIDRIIYNKKRAKLIFDDLKLVPGNYEIYVKNPGGPETSAPGFLIEYQKPLDLFFKVSWIPVFPAYGDFKRIFGTEMYMAGTGLSFEAVSSARSSFNGGLEISVAAFALNPLFTFQTSIDELKENISKAGNWSSCAEFDLNILFQKQFMLKRMSVTFRFGVGATLMGGFGSINTDGLFMHLNIGLSYLYVVHELFFVEAGAVLSHFFDVDPSGLIKPKLTVGWMF